MEEVKKELLMSAVIDMFLNDCYDGYSIGGGYTVYRIDDVETWEDEGFIILDENGDEAYLGQAGGLVENETTFKLDLGGCLNHMVNHAISCYENYVKATEEAEE